MPLLLCEHAWIGTKIIPVLTGLENMYWYYKYADYVTFTRLG